jgi:hypothetical protein
MRVVTPTVSWTLILCLAAAGNLCADNVGHVEIQCEPGISIFLDGQPRGSTAPDRGGLLLRDVPEGRHVLRGERQGYQAQELTIEVQTGRILEVRWNPFVLEARGGPGAGGEPGAEPATGVLMIQTVPVECEIGIPSLGVVSGRKRTDVWTIERVPEGKHSLQFRALGTELAHLATVGRGETIRILADLQEGRVYDSHSGPAVIRRVPKIGLYFPEGTGNAGPGGNFALIRDLLCDEFLVEVVSPGEGDRFPGDIDLLIVVAGDRVPERHALAIDQYLMSGRRIEAENPPGTVDGRGGKGAVEGERQPGRVVFLLETFDEAMRANRGQWGQPALFKKVESGLAGMLLHWGILCGSDLVLDLDRCAFGQIDVPTHVEGQGMVSRPKTVRWPRIILSRNENYSRNLEFVNGLDQIAFIDATSVSPAEPLPAGIRYEPAVRTSKKSWHLDFRNAPFILGS